MNEKILMLVVSAALSTGAMALPPKEAVACAMEKIRALQAESATFRTATLECRTHAAREPGCRGRLCIHFMGRSDGRDMWEDIAYAAPPKWIIQTVQFAETVHIYKPWYSDLTVSPDKRQAQKSVACRIGTHEAGGGYLHGTIVRSVTKEDEDAAIGECLAK